jgi:hypothetical protein
VANGNAVRFLGTREREHDEVLPFWLGEGDHEAHRRGKRAVVLQRNSDEGSGASALSTDARALQRGEEGGVVELQCRARPRNEREWQRPSTAFDRKEKGKWGGGSSVSGATRRKEGALARSRHAEEDGVGAWQLARHVASGGSGRSGVCRTSRGAGSARGPAGEKKQSGPSQDEQ